MKKITLSNEYKKNFLEYETYEKIIGGTTYTFTVEVGWRYGSVEIEVPDEYTKEKLENTLKNLYDKDGVLNIEDIPFDWSLGECFDSFSLDYTIPDNIPDDIREKLEEYLEENGTLSLDEDGWYCDECRYVIVNEFKLEEEGEAST